MTDVGIGPKDPRFIGAWWLGFIVLGFATMLIAIPLMCFPRTLKPIRHEQDHGHTPRKKVFVLRKELKGRLLTSFKYKCQSQISRSIIGSIKRHKSFGNTLNRSKNSIEDSMLLQGVRVVSVVKGLFYSKYIFLLTYLNEISKT